MSATASAAWRFAVFTVVTVLATALLAITIGNVDFRRTVTYHALFSDAVSLNKGDEVRMAGVRIGSVDGVDLTSADLAKVTFDVDRDVPLTAATQAVIRYRNLIGQRYLALLDGDGGGAPLSAGATIPLDRTRPALNLNALFYGFKPLLVALSPGDVNKLSYELIQVLQGEGGTVQALLAHLGSLSGTLADHDAVIGQVIDNLNAVLGPLDQRDQRLSDLITNLQRFVSGLSADRQAIATSFAGIDQLTGTTAGLLRDARPALKDDIAQLGVLAARLDTTQSRALLETFLRYSPFKLQVATPEGSYGAFLNFYVCAVNFVLPDGTVTDPNVNSAARCHQRRT